MLKEQGTRIGLLALRLVTGVVFLAHGWDKLISDDGSKIVEHMRVFGEQLGQLGVPAPIVMAWMVACLEMAGGIALILGVAPRIAAGLLGCVMAVGVFRVHLMQGLLMKAAGKNKLEGMELALVLLATCVCIALAGGGMFEMWGWPGGKKAGEKKKSA